MHVAFDHQIFSLQRWGGISRYHVELMRRIPGQPGIDLSWFRGHGIDELGQPDWIDGLKRYRRLLISSDPVPLAEQERLNWVGLEEFCQELPVGRVYHPTYYSARALQLAGSSPLVMTVYDLMPERFFRKLARFRSLLRARRRLIERADLILVISQCTRRDLMEIHQVPAERIRVTYLASDLGAGEPDWGPEVQDGERPYFLWVGTRSKYKNFTLLLDAYVNEPRLHEFDVKVFGGTGPLLEPELKKLAAAGLEHRFHYRQGHDRVLEEHYRGAVGLVYASRYEGFGLPPLEAMQCGCPVICCPVGSLPEVVGEAAVLVDPDDPAGLAQAMLRLASDRTERDQLVARGKERAAMFSWDRTAMDTLAAYRSLAG